MTDITDTKFKGRRVLMLHPRGFPEYTQPNGFLIDDVACQGLFHYALIARNNYEQETQGIVLEGDRDPEFNYKQLFMSIATMYATTPERMVRFWQNVDMQMTVLKLPKVPDEERLRFSKTPEVKTQ